MTQEQEFLFERIKEMLTVQTDEAEGTQVIDIYNINACNPDYVEMEEPKLTPEEIRHMLHLDDPNIFPGLDDTGTGQTTDDTGETDDNGLGNSPLVDNNGFPTSSDDIPGTDSGGLVGDRGDSSDGSGEDDSSDKSIEKWNDIKVPDDTDMSKIADAIINDDTIGSNKVIIEFATPSIQNEDGVDFQLYVKPGEELTENTIIGKATVNGITKEIKSIFSSGTVAKNEAGGFKRLYESCGADRHIIIENYEICGERPDVNTDRIQEMVDEFTNEAYINQLISDNIADSVLPIILQKRYDKYKYKMVGPLKVRDERPNGREIYSKYIDKVQKIRDEYLDDIQNMGTEKNIKKTNGNVRKINKLGYEIIDRRKKYTDDMVYMYSEYSRTLDPCEFDEDNFYDCRYLAYDHKIEYRDKEVNLKVGNTEYSNYYTALLSKIDMMNTENKYAIEYYNIIKEIIEIRMAYEKYKPDDIIKEFNNLFKSSINKSQSNAYKKLNDTMKKKKEDITYSDVYSWIAQKAGKTKTKKGEKYIEFAQRQLVNIFLFLWNYHEYKIPTPAAGEKEKTFLDLVKEEWKKISDFWDKVLAIREHLTIDYCVKQFEDFAKYGQQYHNWPPFAELSIGDDLYEHYLFQNYDEPDNTIEDEDYGMDYETTPPEIPDSMDPPGEDLGPEDLLPSGNDVEPNEISIIDFKYWVRYFALATVISIPYLNCGLDIIPFVQLIPLPVIMIAIASVYIRILDLVIVFGITIRGMYIFPCVLFVNLSSVPLSINTALIAALKTIQSKINAKINAIAESTVSSIGNAMIKVLESDNRRLRNENQQIDAAISALEAKKVKNMENIKRGFLEIYKPNVNLTQQINNPLANI